MSGEVRRQKKDEIWKRAQGDHRIFSIRFKLLLSFGVVLFLLLVVGAKAVTGIDVIGTGAGKIQNEKMPAVIMLAKTGSLAAQIEGDITSFVMEIDPSAKDNKEIQLKDRMAEMNKQIRQTAEILSDPHEKELLNQFSEKWDGYLKHLPELSEISRTNDISAENKLLTNLRPDLIMAQGIIDNLIQIQQENTSREGQQTVKQIAATKTLILTLSIAALAIGLFVAFLISGLIARPVKMLAEQVRSIASGDMTVSVLQVRTRDEIGTLVRDFNRMTDNLKTMIGQLLQSSTQVSDTSVELRKSAGQTGEAAKQIAVAIQEVASGSERQSEITSDANMSALEIRRGMDHIAQSVDSVVKNSADASTKAEEGNRILQATAVQMQTINEKASETEEAVHILSGKAKEIHAMLELVTNVSKSINILGLNAGIEATRAGMQGKGFIVIAEEIRKLADQTAKAVHEIKNLVEDIDLYNAKAVNAIEESVGAVKDGLEKVQSASEAFDGISRSIADMSGRTEEVSAVVQQVNAGSHMLASSMTQIMEFSRETAASSEEVTASVQEQTVWMTEVSSAAGKLSDMASALRDSIRKFKLE